MDSRELKGLELAARSKIAFDAGFWLVPSQSTAQKYKVVLAPGASTCECEDFALTRKPCKHIHAARIARERDHGGEQVVLNTDVIPVKKTYAQDWPKYDEAQRTEKNRFQALLFDLCRNLENVESTKSGRKWKPMADMIFACAFKVYSTFSSRRFQCDLDDALARGYLSESMHSVRVCAYMDSEFLTPVLESLIARSSLPLRAVETVFAPDSSGFSTSRFEKWFDEKWGQQRSGHVWVKAHAICGVRTNIVTGVRIMDKDSADCPHFKPLVEMTAENFKIEEVPADKAYLSRENLEQIEKLGAAVYVPFKSNSVAGEAGTVWEKLFHYYQFRRDDFLKHYHQRSNMESTFSMVKAKFRDHVRSKTDTAMKNEVLCKFLCHNICVVHQSQIELGIEPIFWQDEPKSVVTQQADVLKFNRLA
jgi:transposase